MNCRWFAAALTACFWFACTGEPVPSATAKVAAADAVATTDAATDATAKLGADAATLPTRPDLAWDLAVPGPNGVGYRTFSYTYVPAAGDPTRTIGVNLWYPSPEKTGTLALYMDFWPSKVAVVDAKAAPPTVAAGYPVLVYSHGYSGFGGSSPWLAEHFASHGWVVIAPDHTGNMLPDNDAPKPTALWWWRARDVTAAIDFVGTLADKAGLAGKPLLDKVILGGHSFGGYTTLCLLGAKFDIAVVAAACKEGKGLGGACSEHDIQQYAAGLGDKRVVGGMLLQSGEGNSKWFGTLGMAAIAVPVFLITGDADGGHLGPNQWKTLQPIASIANSLWVDVKKGCHQLLGLGKCGEVDEAEGLKITRTYTLAFARRWLLGDMGQVTIDVLSGALKVSELVTLHHGK
ncbi:MAG: hypothetical protein EXR77_18875 [Myxococcales bacterium]|nr:hypothetical protein [Myxococcales bacterium]